MGAQHQAAFLPRSLQPLVSTPATARAFLPLLLADALAAFQPSRDEEEKRPSSARHWLTNVKLGPCP